MELNEEEIKKRLIKKSADISHLTRKVYRKDNGFFKLRYKWQSLSEWILLGGMFIGSSSMIFFPDIVNSHNNELILRLLLFLNLFGVLFLLFLFFPYDINFFGEGFFTYRYGPFGIFKKRINFSNITNINIFSRKQLLNLSRSLDYYDVQYTLDNGKEYFLFSNRDKKQVEEFITIFLTYHKVDISDYSSLTVSTYKELSPKKIILYTYLSVLSLIAFMSLVIFISNHYFN